ncbi:MAG TPA: RNA polymerase sigma factor, partial [Balneolaceae bacterium]|nr:RNA polymerase sigma factor [Balneolaceae bacterium]
PVDQRVVVIMKEYEGLTFREIAGILDEPENTVKSRLYYGLSALKKTFDSWNINKEVFDYE